jgi:hypothetical protein
MRSPLDIAGAGAGLVLGAVAAVRRGKPVHPHGAAYSARLVVPGAASAPPSAALLSRPGRHAAIVRFSRSLGVPRPLPDLLGLSIRIPNAYGDGAHQDFLLVTSIDRPVLDRIFVPARDAQQRPYSSSLPYRAGGERFLIGALPRASSPRPPGDTELDRVRAAAATGRLAFDLAVAPPRGRFRAVAELRIGEPLPQAVDALRFNPFNCGGGVEPAGALNAMRRTAYPISQAAWRRAQPGGGRAQDAAERVLAAPQ